MLKVSLNTQKFDKKRAMKIRTACALLERIINTPDFKEFCMANNIWDKLEKGLQPTETTPDFEIDVNAILYKSRNKVVGYTYLNSIYIWINQKFFDKFNYVQIAQNIFHETLHQILQYSHKNDGTMWTDIVYRGGNIIGTIGRKYGWDK